MQPNVEIMIAIAIICAPAEGITVPTIALATRSSGVVWILSNGSTARYATLANKYRLITIPVPKASESGTFRRGSRTSPAVNVILFHASAENSDPVCATRGQPKAQTQSLVLAPGPTE